MTANTSGFLKNIFIVFFMLVALTFFLLWVALFVAEGKSGFTFTVLGQIGDIFSGVGTVLAAVAGIQGIDSWKKQITGKQNHELARDISIVLVEFRERIQETRQSGILFWPPSELNDQSTFSHEEFDEFDRRYQGHLDAIRSVQLKSSPILLQAKALWRDDIPDLVEEVYLLKHRLVACIILAKLILNPDMPLSRKQRALNQLINYDENIYLWNDGDDPFSQELQRRIDNVEAALEKYLLK